MLRTVVLIAALLSVVAPAQAGFFFEGDGIPAHRTLVSPSHFDKTCHCGAHHRVRHASIHHHRAARCVK